MNRLCDQLPNDVDKNSQKDESEHKSYGIEVLRPDFHEVLKMGRREIGEMHGTINAHTEGQQSDYLKDESLFPALPPEDEKDDGDDDV